MGEKHELYEQIKQKKSLISSGDLLDVFENDTTILIKGRADVLSEAYSHSVPGEITLSIESAKKFLEVLDKVIIINKYYGNDIISFKVTEGNRLVFAKDGKEISNNDILMLYYNLERKEEKSDLPLALNMIKVRGLYNRYVDLYEQAEKKHRFFESYNELITAFAGKREAIRFAKKNKETWLKIRPYQESRDFDISEGEDIVDTIVNGEDITFNKNVPLEKKQTYLTNLDNYEIIINNLIERLEQETVKIEAYIEKANEILEQISKSNIFSVKPIEELPQFDCISEDDILTEEKQKYDEIIEEKNKSNDSASKTLDEEYPWLRDIDEQQRSKFNKKEKDALMLYKSAMYHLFNNIISYVRSNDLNINEISNDEYVESLIQREYQEYLIRKKAEEEQSRKDLFYHVHANKNKVYTIVDDYFPSNKTLSYDEYRKIVFNNIGLLEPALSKVTLSEPLTVYRCVNVPKNAAKYNGDLGNALLSTTTSVQFVSDFIKTRKKDIEYDTDQVIYKIELPAGSPIAAFTNDVFRKSGSPEAGFGEPQHEILIDSNNYDFEFVGSDYNQLNDESFIDFITIKATPKELELENDSPEASPKTM